MRFAAYERADKARDYLGRDNLRRLPELDFDVPGPSLALAEEQALSHSHGGRRVRWSRVRRGELVAVFE